MRAASPPPCTCGSAPAFRICPAPPLHLPSICPAPPPLLLPAPPPQLRGSIPLVWGHGEQKHMVPRPDIHLQQIDPMYELTYKHFNDLYQRCASRSRVA